MISGNLTLSFCRLALGIAPAATKEQDLQSLATPAAPSYLGKLRELANIRQEIKQFLAFFQTPNTDQETREAAAAKLKERLDLAQEKLSALKNELSSLPKAALSELAKTAQNLGKQNDPCVKELQALIAQASPSSGIIQTSYALHRIAAFAEKESIAGQKLCQASSELQQGEQSSIQREVARLVTPLLRAQEELVLAKLAELPDNAAREKFVNLLLELNREEQAKTNLPGEPLSPAALYFTEKLLGQENKGLKLTAEEKSELSNNYLKPLLEALDDLHKPTALAVALAGRRDPQLYPLNERCQELFALGKQAANTRDQLLDREDRAKLAERLPELEKTAYAIPSLCESSILFSKQFNNPFSFSQDLSSAFDPEQAAKLSAELSSASSIAPELDEFSRILTGSAQKPTEMKEVATETIKPPTDLCGAHSLVLEHQLIHELKNGEACVKRLNQAITQATEQGNLDEVKNLQEQSIELLSNIYSSLQKRAEKLGAQQNFIVGKLLTGLSDHDKDSLITASRAALNDCAVDMRKHISDPANNEEPLAACVSRYLQSNSKEFYPGEKDMKPLLAKIGAYLEPLREPERIANSTLEKLFGEFDPKEAEKTLAQAIATLEDNLQDKQATLSKEELAQLKNLAPALKAISPEFAALDLELKDSPFFANTSTPEVSTLNDYPQMLISQLGRFQAAQLLKREIATLQTEGDFPDERYQTALALHAILGLSEKISASGKLPELEQELKALTEELAGKLGDKNEAIALLTQAAEKQGLLLGVEMRRLPEKTRQSSSAELTALALAHPERKELRDFAVFYRNIHFALVSKDRLKELEELKEKQIAESEERLRLQSEEEEAEQGKLRKKEVPPEPEVAITAKNQTPRPKEDSVSGAAVSFPPRLRIDLLAQTKSALEQLKLSEVRLASLQDGKDTKRAEQVAYLQQTVAELVNEAARLKETALSSPDDNAPRRESPKLKQLIKQIDSVSAIATEAKAKLQTETDAAKAMAVIEILRSKMEVELNTQQQGLSDKDRALDQALITQLCLARQGRYDSLSSPEIEPLVLPSTARDYQQVEFSSDLRPQLSRFRAAKELERIKMTLQVPQPGEEQSEAVQVAYGQVLCLLARIEESPHRKELANLAGDIRALEAQLRQNTTGTEQAAALIDRTIQKQYLLIAFEYRNLSKETQADCTKEAGRLQQDNSELSELGEFAKLYQQLYQAANSKDRDKKVAQAVDY